jgi:hypothetical protein
LYYVQCPHPDHVNSQYYRQTRVCFDDFASKRLFGDIAAGDWPNRIGQPHTAKFVVLLLAQPKSEDGPGAADRAYFHHLTGLNSHQHDFTELMFDMMA